MCKAWIAEPHDVCPCDRVTVLQGSVDAHRMLGDHYYYGWGRPVDYTQAVRQYQLAADAVPPNGPNAQSMFNLG